MKESIGERIARYLDLDEAIPGTAAGGAEAYQAWKAITKPSPGQRLARGALIGGGALVGGLAGLAASIAALRLLRGKAKTPEEKERIQKQIDQKKEQLRDKKNEAIEEINQIDEA